MIDFCIVGSGVSGSTLAYLINKKYSIKILDKAKGPGGRTSTRRYHNISFDHGSHYISSSSSSFHNFLKLLEKKKFIRKWDKNHLDLSFEIKNHSKKFIGNKGNNDLCKFLIKNVEKDFRKEIRKIKFTNDTWVLYTTKDKIFCKSLILSCPFPQSLRLLRNYLPKKIKNLRVVMSPIITLMVAFKKNKNIPISSIKIKNHIIDKITYENSKKRFKTDLSCWTIQTTSSYAKKIINKYKAKKKFYTAEIMREFNNITGQNKKPFFYNIHGWKYAFNESTTDLKSYWDSKKKIGLIGDWFIGPSIEDAWNSAQNIYVKIKKNPPKIK